MDVRVTAEHIEAGEPKNPMGCPIALAINDQVTAEDIDVIDAKAYACDLLTTTGNVESASADLPDVAYVFVDRFDRGESVGPIEFTLTWIDEQGCEVSP